MTAKRIGHFKERRSNIGSASTPGSREATDGRLVGGISPERDQPPVEFEQPARLERPSRLEQTAQSP